MHTDTDIDRCLICLSKSSDGLTREHIIPKALGGRLTAKLLCKDCNSSFGSSFESKAKCDLSIRLAIECLKHDLPLLFDRMEQGQQRIIATDAGQIRGTYRNGETRGFTRLDDGSLLQPTESATKTLKTIMAKSGASDEQINDALEKFDDAESGRPLNLAPGLTVVKRDSYDNGPALDSAEQLNPLVSLKIAFEFLALICGSAILSNNEALNAMRHGLQEASFSKSGVGLEKLFAKREYDVFHGIFFERGTPSVTLQIRLFGKISYRLNIPKLTIQCDPFIYTHTLKDNEEYLNWV